METNVETVATPKTGKATTYKPASKRTYEELVSRYRGFAKNAAETIIRRAETLLEAKEKLGGNNLPGSHTFENICHELLGIDSKHSTVRKHELIGKVASTLYPLVDRLPDHWTTIEQVAMLVTALEPEQFKRLTEDRRFKPKMTANDVGQIRYEICPPPEPKKKKGKGGTKPTKAAPSVAVAPSATAEESGTPIPEDLMGGGVGTKPEMVKAPSSDKAVITLTIIVAGMSKKDKQEIYDRIMKLQATFLGKIKAEGLDKLGKPMQK
jgi:hypothetical protein